MCDLCANAPDGVARCPDCGRRICFDAWFEVQYRPGGDDHILRDGQCVYPTHPAHDGLVYCEKCGETLDRAAALEVASNAPCEMKLSVQPLYGPAEWIPVGDPQRSFAFS